MQIPVEDVSKFYRAIKRFNTEMYSDKNKIEMKMTDGRNIYNVDFFRRREGGCFVVIFYFICRSELSMRFSIMCTDIAPSYILL